MAEPDESLVVRVAGRAFRPATSPTFAQQLWLMRAVEEAQLARLPTEIQGSADDWARARLRDLLTAGVVLPLLAGSFVEAEADGSLRPWTEAAARQHLELFANATDPTEREALLRAALGVVTGFFASGRSYDGISPSASPPPPPVTDGPDPSPAEATTSASGIPSSGSSPTTNPTNSR